MGNKDNVSGQHEGPLKGRAFFRKIKAKKTKLTRLCQKAYNLSGGPQNFRAGEERVKGIISCAPAGHDAKLIYYERHIQNVGLEIEHIRAGGVAIPVLDNIVLDDDELELVADPGVDQGNLGGVGNDAPGVPIAILEGGWVQGWIQKIWVGG